MQVPTLSLEETLEKEMATYSSILAWGILWTEEPGGYSPWDSKELDMTEHSYYIIIFAFICCSRFFS